MIGFVDVVFLRYDDKLKAIQNKHMFFFVCARNVRKYSIYVCYINRINKYSNKKTFDNVVFIFVCKY